MQRLEVSGAVRPIYVLLGVKRLSKTQLYDFHRQGTHGAGITLFKTISWP